MANARMQEHYAGGVELDRLLGGPGWLVNDLWDDPQGREHICGWPEPTTWRRRRDS